MKGKVVDQLPNGLYRVRLENQHEALAHAGGANSAGNFVRLSPGDLVEVELSPLDPTRGRIQNRVTFAAGAKSAAGIEGS
ncbi:MAG: translation initiation factor IF-1 [Bryobacterales bacterium]|nr:translation initiation factor IF-1 [Bryobacterales bacterium]